MVFSGFSGSPTNKPDRHDRTEIFLKVALNTIPLIKKKEINDYLKVVIGH
jgi:hypothetical protein